MPAVVEAALDAVRPAAAARSIALHVELDPQAGPVSGDPDRLQQVVWNLLTNAIKFTPRQGQVHVTLQRAGLHVELEVRDTGRGIRPEVLPYIFERFRQADSSTTRAHGGLGIGLALVRHLVELHGGTVQAHSAGEGQGATLTVTLPLRAHAERLAVDRHPRAVLAHESLARDALAGLNVLALDDDAESRELLGQVLSQAGATVRLAGSVAQALDVLDGWRADAVLSDIEMPDDDGYAFIRMLRSRGADRGGAVPAVAVTAYGRNEDRIRVLAAGYQQHLPKPVEPAELIAVIVSVVNRRASKTS
jgi:CheY-like chemotaxis protein